MDFFGLLFEPEVETVLARLEKEREKANFWNVPRSSATLLYSMVTLFEAKNVLEIGTSNGYSGIFLAHAARSQGGRLFTIESHKERFSLAQKNFEEAGLGAVITQVQGHAPEVLHEMDLNVRFDFVFIDATKMEYEQYVEAIGPLLHERSVIVADNILSHWEDLEGFVQKIRDRKEGSSILLEMDSGLLVFTKGS